jgi:hypothetical protein
VCNDDSVRSDRQLRHDDHLSTQGKLHLCVERRCVDDEGDSTRFEVSVHQGRFMHVGYDLYSRWI